MERGEQGVDHRGDVHDRVVGQNVQVAGHRGRRQQDDVQEHQGEDDNHALMPGPGTEFQGQGGAHGANVAEAAPEEEGHVQNEADHDDPAQDVQNHGREALRQQRFG